jgi:hypothetical protein
MANQKVPGRNKISPKIRIIDLGNISGSLPIIQTGTIYGLAELNRRRSGLQNIANPGCFATTIQLGLLPLASRLAGGHIPPVSPGAPARARA